ncbi:RagB/SusD family nutrient uptake outer membrane protein [Weeksellaceae bacterium TAE3-ERU29]|nr:RagB/SusD family nutrient uptake outer membrane protein [Weeksellaceae bacterium TAE3-ERU29]
MKKNILYLTTIILGLTLGACSLEENPTYAFNSKDVFNSEATANAVIDEAYGHLANLYGNNILRMTIANGTMVARVSTSEETRAAAYDIDPEGSALNASFQGIYDMIDTSNRIMVGMENSSLSEDYKKEALGQAYFIRGYGYYLLGSLWGRAAIQLTPVKVGESLHRPLSSRTEIYEQAEKDWLMAADKLSETKKIGQADKNVANAYLAKLYFMLASQKQSGIESSNYASADELWKKTIEYGEKVNGKEYLDPDYAGLFGSGVSMSNEILFQLNYTSATVKGLQKNWTGLFSPYYYTYYTAVVGKPDSYRTIVMDRAFYDYHAGTHPGDARIKTIYLNQYLKETRYKTERDRQGVSYPFVLDPNDNIINARDFMLPGSDPRNPEYNLTGTDPNPEMNYVKGVWTNLGYGIMSDKLFPFSGKGSDKNSSANYDTNDVILFRNADLLLLLADAYNETGNGAKADQYINMVLNRAKLNNVESMGQSERREFIFFERMFELAGEPILFEDVRRRGTEYLKKIIEIHNNSWFINFRYNLERENNNGTPFITIIINDKNLNEDFLKKNLLLPIPQSEIIRNDNVSQKDQNFGYN